MAACELERGDAIASAERLDQAEPVLLAHDDAAQSARLALLRAELSWRRGGRADARELATRSRDGYDELGPTYALDRAQAERWLERHPVR
jgi:hypothetical protein